MPHTVIYTFTRKITGDEVNTACFCERCGVGEGNGDLRRSMRSSVNGVTDELERDLGTECQVFREYKNEIFQAYFMRKICKLEGKRDHKETRRIRVFARILIGLSLRKASLRCFLRVASGAPPLVVRRVVSAIHEECDS